MGLSDFIDAGEFALRKSSGVEATHPVHVAFGELGVPVPPTSRVDVPALAVAVGCVVGWSAEEKVAWVDTSRPVAFVQDL